MNVLLIFIWIQTALCLITLEISPSNPMPSSQITITGIRSSGSPFIGTIVLSTDSFRQTVLAMKLGDSRSKSNLEITIGLDARFKSGDIVTVKGYFGKKFVTNTMNFTVAGGRISLSVTPSLVIPGTKVVLSGMCPVGKQKIDKIVLSESVSNFHQTAAIRSELSFASSIISTILISRMYPFGSALNFSAFLSDSFIPDTLTLGLANQNVTLSCLLLSNEAVEARASVSDSTQLINQLVLSSNAVSFVQSISLGRDLMISKVSTPITTVLLSPRFPGGSAVFIHGCNNSTRVTMSACTIERPNSTLVLTQNSTVLIQGGQIALGASATKIPQKITSIVLFEPVSNHYQTVTPTNKIVSTAETLISSVVLEHDFPAGSTITGTVYNESVLLAGQLHFTLTDGVVGFETVSQERPRQGGVLVLRQRTLFGSLIIRGISIYGRNTGHLQIHILPTSTIVSASGVYLSTITLDKEFPSGSTLTISGFK